MTQDDPTISRRRLLTAIGAGGLLASGGSYALGRRPDYTHYTYARTADSERLVRIGWYETYNGRRVERSNDSLTIENDTTAGSTWNRTADAGGFTDDPQQPAITIDNALPGDHGSVVVGLHSDAAPAAVWFALVAEQRAENGTGLSAENGRNEPEITAGDASPDEGELADALNLRIWYDVGVGGYGACNGQHDLEIGGDLLDEPLLLEGTLRDASRRLSEYVPIATDDAESVRGCLDGSGALCLGIEWWIDAGTANRFQGDAVAFALSFAAAECGAETPFGGGQ